MTRSYTIYGGELSLFTRKLEAAMIFYRAEFAIQRKIADNREEIELRSGTHQVPVLHTPENWMIGDTTPIIQLLDARFPNRRLFPEGLLGVLVHLLEEHFDEWVARVMVHYRWHYPESAEFASERIGGGDPKAAARILEWGPRACRATGTESQHQREAAEAEYERVLAAMEAQLEQTRWMLGDRPTALDCILLGGLRAHTNMDPDPKRVTAAFPKVVAWAEGAADSWEASGALAPFPESTAFARFVLGEMAATWKPYVLGNREALAAGARSFVFEAYGEEVSYLTRPYPEQSRQMIRERIERLSGEERSEVKAWLERIELDEALSAS